MTEGLRTDQAPPLWIPMSFFATAPVALVAAGTWLAVQGGVPFLQSWLPQSIAAVHLGTIGLLAAVMFGALYQMVPVVAGAPVPAIRVAHAVHAALIVGLIGLVAGIATGDRTATGVGFAALTFAVIGLLMPVAIALARAPVRTVTVTGIRWAVIALAILAFLGLRLAWGHATGALPAARTEWLTTHVAVALIGWVGGLITSVSWQVVPMFYLTPAFPPWTQRLTVWAAGFTTVATPVAAWLAPSPWAIWAALPGAAAVWIFQPTVCARQLARRRRKRGDASLTFWRSGLAIAPVVFVVGLVAVTSHDPRWPILFGWLAVWGWAGLIVHGMLTRIAPFLIWFHRFSALAGLAPVPPMRKLLPDTRGRLGWALHLAAVVIGAAAIVTGWWPLARLAGVALIGAGVVLGYALFRALSWPVPAIER